MKPMSPLAWQTGQTKYEEIQQIRKITDCFFPNVMHGRAESDCSC